MTDFHVVPDALKQQAQQIMDTSDHYKNSSSAISTHGMGEKLLGYFGTDVVHKFNAVATNLVEKLDKGKDTVKASGETIMNCAKHFEQLDAEYYRQFGYIDEQIGH